MVTDISKMLMGGQKKAKGFIPQSHIKKVTNFGQQKLPL
jgi:hypothetical protein